MNILTKPFTCALFLFVAVNLHATERPVLLAQAATKQTWINAKKKSAEKEGALVLQLHDKIVGSDQPLSEAEMKIYTNTFSVPDRNVPHRIGAVTFVSVMTPIKGGEFMMGSPETEANRRADEGPQHRVKISPFWMQQCEVTWDEYEPFRLDIEQSRTRTSSRDGFGVNQLSDAVSKPSKPYIDMAFGMGTSGFPAIAMTQHAANKYCQWLSAKTGHFYRLPTEAEWEYACRAGSTNAYSFGDDRAKLADYAWWWENSQFKYQKVARKKPNPWGLYDMHGNVAEWCLDQYDPNFYMQQRDSVSVNPWNKATQPYPHVVRGGSWDDDPDQLRSAFRGKSDKSWKRDPMLPPSFWHADNAMTVGFRVVRPLKVPSAEEMYHYWNSGVENEARW